MATLAQLLQAAREHHRAGRFAEAESLCRQILERDPRQSDALHLFGIQAHMAGRPDLALQAIDQAIAIDPSRAIYHFDLGEAHRKLGRADEALASYQRSVRLDPHHVPTRNSLGILQQQRGAWPEAEAHFREAARLGPDFPSILNNLGAILLLRGKMVEAAPALERALRLRPNYPDALINLGAVQIALGQFSEAQTLLETGLALKPNDAVAHHNLGIVLHKTGRWQESESCFRRALQLRPDYVPAHCELGSLLKDGLRLDEAQACLEQALRIDPASVQSLKTLAAIFAVQGNVAEARTLLRRANAIQPSDELRVRAALMLPPLYESMDQLRQERIRFQEDVAQLATDALSLSDPAGKVGLTAFFLAYQGIDDRDLQVSLATTFRKSSPELSYVAAHCREPSSPPTASGRIHVGFVSTFFHRHTIGKLNLGFIRNLSRERFSVTLFRFPGPDDAFARSLDEAADRVVRLSPRLETAREQIAAERLNVLYFTDIGMEPLTYFLAFARLAPVQCVSWGHPVTTGISTIDYFLSSAGMETETSDAHYSERLIRFDRVNCCYPEPSLPTPAKSRRELGLEEEAHLYVCSQSLFKVHPEFDPVLGAILEADPQGRIVLIGGNQSHWERLLTARFRRSFPEQVDRVRFIPALSPDDFLQLQAVADVLLDTFPFGGGNTTYEALALGTPVVTLPTDLLRGRLTYAFYQQIEVLDCVATGSADYVNIAVRLGTDPAWRDEVRRRIIAGKDRLYDDLAAVRELEVFLHRAVGQAPSEW